MFIPDSLKEISPIIACFTIDSTHASCNSGNPPNNFRSFLLIVENHSKTSESIQKIQEIEQFTYSFEETRDHASILFCFKENPPQLAIKIYIFPRECLETFELDEFSSLKEIFSRDPSILAVLQQKLEGKKEEKSIEKFLETRFQKIAIDFEHASRLYFYGRPYGFYRKFNSAINHAIEIFSLLKNQSNDLEFQEKLLGNIENEFERRFLEGLFSQPTEIYANLYKRKFLDFMEWLSDELIEKYPDLESMIMKTIEFLNSIYERDYLWNMRPILGSKTLYRGPDPKVYNEDNRVMNFFKKNNITITIDLRGESEAKKAADFRAYLQNRGINTYVINFNELPDNTQNLYGYVKKLIHRADELAIALRLIINNQGSTYIHCHSGKDRTGVFSALMMKLFGRSNEEIIQEYCRTGLDARKERILSVIKYLDEKYPNIDDYFREIGLNEDEIRILKMK
jgi:Tfp pilus assembly protein PilP